MPARQPRVAASDRRMPARCPRTTARYPHTPAGERSRLGAILWLLGVLLLLGGVPLPTARASIQLAPDPSAPVFADHPEHASPVPIGEPGNLKDYYHIDTGCPLLVRGRGELRFYIRGHADPEGAPPETLSITLSGLEGFPVQRWQKEVSVSSVSIFGDGRPGSPTGGKRITLAIPPGLHRIIVTGTSNTGGPVYAVFYYDGPPTEEPATPESAAAEPAAPKPPAGEPKVKPSPWRLSGGFFFDVIYDNNICRYSDDSLAEFRAGTRPERYAIETEDDLILNPTIQFELAHKRLLFNKRTRLRVRYKRWEYPRNGIKTNEEINLRFRQSFRRYDYLEATYTYAPNSYIKELSDRPPFSSLSVPREYLHFAITRNAFSLGYRWRTNRWLAMQFFARRVLRFYNRPFLENDLWEWSGLVNADIRYHRFTTRLQYEYADVKARGYDEVGETLETSDNDGDGSYEKDTYRLRITYSPKKSPYRPKPRDASLFGHLAHWAERLGAWVDQGLALVRTASCNVQITYARQFYTSERPLYVDPLHVGRLDESKQLQATWSSRQVYKDVSLKAGVRYTVRVADAPAGLIGEDDPSEEKDYTGTRYWISFAVPLR
ncbi:MAG: hypothetical protein KAY32_11275 [Candidatus Eisenbacteria sp.]|nr:hypothetical protein [Candidatus Eisenbacteria bacterium]